MNAVKPASEKVFDSCPIASTWVCLLVCLFIYLFTYFGCTGFDIWTGKRGTEKSRRPNMAISDNAMLEHWLNWDKELAMEATGHHLLITVQLGLIWTIGSVIFRILPSCFKMWFNCWLLSLFQRIEWNDWINRQRKTADFIQSPFFSEPQK